MAKKRKRPGKIVQIAAAAYATEENSCVKLFALDADGHVWEERWAGNQTWWQEVCPENEDD